MRARDFLLEADSGDFGKILTAVSLLHSKIIDGEMTQQIPTGMVLRYIKNTGITNFSYADLLVANDKEPALKSLIKNINPDTITFTSDVTQNITNPEEYIGGADNPEQTVSNMAKSALKRRQK
jgi:hypothetical protein